MRRWHLFEFTDLPWYPDLFRRMQTDYLPRMLSRFLWTYLVPVVPLATCWDGVISLLRVYSPHDLDELAGSVQCKGYTWECGVASSGAPPFVFTYLLGFPG